MFIASGLSVSPLTFKARRGLFEFSYGIDRELWWKMTDEEKEAAKAAYNKQQEEDPRYQNAQIKLKEYEEKLKKLGGLVGYDLLR